VETVGSPPHDFDRQRWEQDPGSGEHQRPSWPVLDPTRFFFVSLRVKSPLQLLHRTKQARQAPWQSRRGGAIQALGHGACRRASPSRLRLVMWTDRTSGFRLSCSHHRGPHRGHVPSPNTLCLTSFLCFRFRPCSVVALLFLGCHPPSRFALRSVHHCRLSLLCSNRLSASLSCGLPRNLGRTPLTDKRDQNYTPSAPSLTLPALS
jgi:hypothetical protein